MQGRLSPIVDGRIQAFPWDHWRAEFPAAEGLGLGLVEWTLDHERLGQNPLMTPARARPMTICMAPATTVAASTAGHEPSVAMADNITTVRPAAGPLTLTAEPLSKLTSTPPTMPATTPASSGAPEASEMPKHNGSATRNTTSPAGASCPMVLNSDALGLGSAGAAAGTMGVPVWAGEEVT